MAIVDVEREAPVAEPELEVSRETYEGLLLDGETPEEALQRLEKTRGYQKLIGSDAGQALLAAATAQTASIPNGGVKRKSKAAARAEVLAATDPTADELEAIGIPIELQVAVAAGEAEEDEPDEPRDAPPTDVEDVSTLTARGMDIEAYQLGVGELRAKRVEAPTAMAIAIASIEVATNVREDLGDLEELTASIREHGILEPIVVTGVYGADGKAKGFRVLAGHRRLAAAAAAGYETVPAIFDHRHELGEPGARRSTTQLVENLQREDLNLIDVAHAIAAIVEADPKLTHAETARWVGKDRTWVTNALRLLDTAPEVQAAVAENKISATHARAIAAVDVDLQTAVLERVVDQGLSAKDTERQAQQIKGDGDRIRRRDAGIAKRLAEAIAMLGKVANREKASIAVSDYYTGTEITKGLTADGWHAIDGSNVQVITQAGECGCDGVWRLSVPYNDEGRVMLNPGCSSAEHAAARRQKIDEAWKRDQARANEDRRKEREAALAAAEQAKGVVDEILAERPPSALARRLVVVSLLVVDDGDDAMARYLADKYLDRDAAADDDALFDLEDPLWAITEAIPEEDLDAVQARLVAKVVGYAGPGVRAAVDEWSKLAHPESFELAETTPATTDRKRLAKDVRLGAAVVIGGDEYVVVGITHPGQDPAIVELGIKGAVKAVDYRLHRVQLADLTADTKARVWRAPQGAVQVARPSQRVMAPVDDAAAIAEAREPGGVLECVGSNHVPGCAHQGGEIPPARPAPADA